MKRRRKTRVPQPYRIRRSRGGWRVARWDRLDRTWADFREGKTFPTRKAAGRGLASVRRYLRPKGRNPGPAIRLVETRRGCAIAESRPRYDVLLYGKLFGQLYWNVTGYRGVLPTPPDAGTGKLSIGERSVAVYKQEVAKLNREWADYDRSYQTNPRATRRNPCPGCGSKVATLLGTLGNLRWFRCRDCGIDYNKKARRRWRKPMRHAKRRLTHSEGFLDKR